MASGLSGFGMAENQSEIKRAQQKRGSAHRLILLLQPRSLRLATALRPTGGLGSFHFANQACAAAANGCHSDSSRSPRFHSKGAVHVVMQRADSLSREINRLASRPSPSNHDRFDSSSRRSASPAAASIVMNTAPSLTMLSMRSSSASIR